VRRVVLGLGIDLVELDRIHESLSRWGDRLVEKLMDPPEAASLPIEAGERALAVALAIAGKEAVSKALGTGWSRGVQWRHVVVSTGPGTPTARLAGRASSVARALGSAGAGDLIFDLRGNLVLAEYRLLS
jgi:holo-[acyl-carrier protein] synthase